MIDIFNEVHKKNSNSVLLLAGQGPLKKEIEDKIKILNLMDSVKLLGQRSDVNELYQAFDIFLLPSLYEGLGVVLDRSTDVQDVYCMCIYRSSYYC